MENCNCEHFSHFHENNFGPKTGHDHKGATAGERFALYVGLVCDECADTCNAGYLV